ncbi:regulatory protein RecX [Pseudidiomarina andamanensis]|uniref:Regulatory protein RecX n=1 Tax=Pseudidiomarina andamanensis TaxID=1940690 RepID=A0AA92ILK4_9GAMM|nr:regulatory protein RecX [Pseudidiomarina andamanensis]MDS0218719.1 recombination regulator RecX [Pseudidiomarina andamanensis]QGT95580.1 regulatory protein RecX [Pseudidiomarina andamanensis]
MTADNETQQAEETLVRLLARREHSARELKQKLKQRGFDHQTIEMVLTKAQENGWQSDRRFAQVWVRACIAKGDGVRKIMAHAPQKGLSSELIEDILQAEQPNWNHACYERLIKKFGETPPQDQKQRDKIVRHLMQRGYSFSEIKQALDRQANADAD